MRGAQGSGLSMAAVSGGERSEPERSAAGAGIQSREVSSKQRRRRFTASYKLEVLAKADGCRGQGEIGALLRGEGLYSSHLSQWRKQRDEGALALMSGRKRGRKKVEEVVSAKDYKRLERENQRLARELEKAELVIGVQKKLSEILRIPLGSPDDDEKS